MSPDQHRKVQDRMARIDAMPAEVDANYIVECGVLGDIGTSLREIAVKAKPRKDLGFRDVRKQIADDRDLLPPRLGMAVFGDLPFFPLPPAPITLVHIPAHRIGTTAATLLLERIKGDDQPARTIVLRHQITVPD